MKDSLFGYKTSYTLRHPSKLWQGIRDLVRDFLERGHKGYAKSDVWNFDSYLAKVIAGGARQLRNGCAYPGVGDADTPEKWHEILTKIAEGFDVLDQGDLWRVDAEDNWISWDTDYDKGQYDRYNYPFSWTDHPKFKEAMELFVNHFPSLWD